MITSRTLSSRGARAARCLPIAALALVVCALSAAPAMAFKPPARGPLPDVDSRNGEAAIVPSSSKDARKSLDRRLGPQGFVDTDRLTGAVARIGRTDGFLTGASDSDPAAIVLGYLRSRDAAFGLDGVDVDRLRLDYRYTSWDGVTHLYYVQASRGVPSFDTGVDAHVTSGGRIVAISARAVPDFGIQSAAPGVSADAALGRAKRNVRGGRVRQRTRTRANAERETFFPDGERASLVVFADPDGERLAWKVIANGDDEALYEVVVDARSGAVLARRSLTDYVANSSVRDNYPGAPGGGGAVTFDLEAPDAGKWINLAGSPRTKLDGNNAHAYADVNDNDAADAGEEVPTNDGANFVYARTPFTQAGCPTPAGCAWDPAAPASKATNTNQVTTELFYLTNKFHDWLRQPPIGFDEPSRNFEHVDTAAAGLGNDRVNAEANDGGGTNNANFATPPDGAQPRMQMYFTSRGGQAQNTSDDASIVFHEYTHGLTNRLVADGSGLGARQSGSMGEGWSDWYALDYLVANGFETDTSAPAELKTGRHSFPPNGVRSEGTDCPVGAPAASCPGTAFGGGTGGYTYGDLGRIAPPGGVHGNGEIWAQTLWDLRTAVGAGVARGLVTGGLRLSAASPSFLTMRDSILQANEAIYAGAHYNAIWQVFAARGMGFNASTPGADSEVGNEDFSLPPLLAPGATTVEDASPLGDADGVVEPGEAIELTQALANPAPSAVNNVNGTLSSSTTGVTIGQATATWGSIRGGSSATNAPALSFTVPASHTCGAPVQLSTALTSAAGNLTVPKAIPTGTPGVILNNTPLPIPDNTPAGVNSTINVPAGASITDLNVQIKDLRHTFVGDLKLTLSHPDGTTVVLMDRPGAGTLGSSADDFLNLVLDDEAASQIDTIPTSGPITGSWKPDQALTALDGKPRQGAWTLNVSDNLGTDTGGLNSWGLDFGDPVRCSTITPPDAVSAAASAITATGATLNGTIDPNATATDYAFQYGASASYGTQTPAAPAGAGNDPVARSDAIGSLAPSTLYHFRVVAIRGGTVVATGADQTFTTLADDGDGDGGGSGSGAGTGGGSAGTGPIRASVVFSQLNSILVKRTGVFKFAFVAAPAGSPGTVTFTSATAVASARKKRRKLRLGGKSFVVPRDGAVVLRPRLSRKNMAALRKRRRIRVVAEVKLGARSFKKTFTLRAPRRRGARRR